MTVLVIAEHRQGRVRDVTYELMAAARELGGPVALAVIGPHPETLGLLGCDVDEVVHVPAADEFESDVYRAALESLIDARRPDVVLVGFTVNGMGFGPAVAARRDLGLASDVFALDRDGPALVATRAFYGGKVHAEVELPAAVPAVLLLRPTAWTASTASGTPTLLEHALAAVPSRARHTGFREAARGDVDITTADFLLAVGRGIGDRDNLALFDDLATRLGATLAVSRPIVDAGWISNVRQVGQSGRTVKPRVYLAFGISGAVQHLAGMKASETIIAVNTDPEAAIFDVATFGAVSDACDVAEELAKLA